jgi:hypothetical protein
MTRRQRSSNSILGIMTAGALPSALSAEPKSQVNNFYD